jgi:hypothetical protein
VEPAQEEEYQQAARFFGEGDLDEEFEEDSPHGGAVQWGEEALEYACGEEGDAAAQEGVQNPGEADGGFAAAEPDEGRDYGQGGDEYQE